MKSTDARNKKEPKKNFKNVEEDNISLLKKIENKMKKKKVSTRNRISSTDLEEYTGKWSTSAQLTTILHNKKAKKLYTTICDENDKYLNTDKIEATNLNKNEFVNCIHISNAPEDEKELTLLKKKKKKKKEDKLKVHNNINLKIDKTILKKRKFYSETCDDNDKHLKKDKTRDSIFIKDEFTRKIPTANTSDGDSFRFKKKKKKKKRDTTMVRNGEHFNNNIDTLLVEKFCNETCDDNDNFYEDELTRSIPIANDSEGNPLFKKKKMKKKGDKIMIQNDENMNNDIVTLKVDKFYRETCDDNDKHLYKDETIDSNFNKDELTRRIPMSNASESDSLFKQKKKKKNRDKKMVQKDKHSKKDKSILNVVQFYNETIDDNIKYLNKINISASNLNKDLTTRIPIANASEDDEELTLLKSPFKKTKKKKKKSKMAINDGTQSSNYVTIQKNLKNMEDLKKIVSKEQSNEIHNDSNMNNTIYNSRISKVHKEEYPEFVKKSLKNKKREQKKAIKDVTRNEVMLQKKSNKHKRQTTDKKYSKNDSLQSVETFYDSNNYIGEDFGNKLELFDSRDDHPSEYRNITDTVMYLGQYCNQIFNNANGVFIHENVLTGNIPVQCDVCFRTFSCKSSLHVHKRTHTGEKPYACNYCGRSFSLHGNLVTHIRTHTGEKPYTCDVCGQSFSQKGTLVTHIRTHTGEKPYTCDVCGRSFSLKSSCVLHYRIHTGERPFECGYCEKKFYSSSHRTRHTRNVHTKCF